MKKLQLLLFLCCLVAGRSPSALAQGQCPSVPYGDMIYQFANWNWEIPTTHANYCKTWATRRINDGRSDALVINAPWVGALNGTLLRIANDQDYTKAKGWELLRMNLGGVTATAMPYFILYNKYTATIRTYFYLDNSGGTYTKGAFVTMAHSSANGSSNSGVLSLAKTQILTPEKYLASTDNNDEIITYVTKLTSNVGGWIVADFSAGYDPYASNSRYSATALEFSVHGVVTNEVSLKGDFNFKTDAQDGYGFAGKKSTVQKEDPAKGVKTFIADNQKVLGIVDKVDAFVTKFAAKSTKTAQNTAAVSAAASAAATANAAAAAAGGVSAFKSILTTAGGINAGLGILSSVIGLLWPDVSTPAAPTFMPTVSNGSISLTGTITTTYPLYSTSVRVPGTPHPSDGSTQTYYDCALGIFTLKNTPVLHKAPWRAIIGYDYSDQRRGPVPYYGNYTSFQVSNDLVASYNEAAGLKLVSVQAALVVKQKRKDVYNQWYMRQQIQSGEIFIVEDTSDSDDSLVTYQTPFLALGDLKRQAITIAHDGFFNRTNPSPYTLSVRVFATLQRKNAQPGAAPIFYVQDYAVSETTTPGVTNPRYSSTTNNEPIYTNLLSALVGNASTSTTNTPNYSLNYTLPAGTYTSPLVVSAAKDILFPGTNPAGSTATFDHAGNGTSFLLSNTGISLGEGFSVRAGTNFVASTPLQDWKQGGQTLVESNGPNQCPYNPAAYRILAAAAPLQEALAGLAIYPNPTQGQFSITAKSHVGGTLTVYDGLGKQVEKIDLTFLGEHTYRVNLTGHAPGLYIVRMQTGQTTVSQKLLLQ